MLQRPMLGRRLAAIRAHRMISQSELAALVGVSKASIHRYEHGHCRIDAGRLAQMAWALSCSPADFFAPAEARLPRLKPQRRPAVYFVTLPMRSRPLGIR